MESARTKKRKDLCQKRLQYFDKFQNQLSDDDINGKSKSSRIARNPNKPAIKPKPTNLAWNTPESSPRLIRRQNVQNSATLKTSAQTVQNSVTMKNVSNASSHQKYTNSTQSEKMKSTASRDVTKVEHHSRVAAKKKDNNVYSNPVRRSLTQAQIFSATHRLPQNRSQSLDDEFQYSFNQFKPVDRDRFFTTKPIEDRTWPSNLDSNTYHDKKSDQNTRVSNMKAHDMSFDADHVHNFLHEMGKVRKIKALVHNELKENFEKGEVHAGKTNNKYGHDSAKHGNELTKYDHEIETSFKFGHDRTKYGSELSKYGHLKENLEFDHNLNDIKTYGHDKLTYRVDGELSDAKTYRVTDDTNIGRTYRPSGDHNAGQTYRRSDEPNVIQTYRVQEILNDYDTHHDDGPDQDDQFKQCEVEEIELISDNSRSDGIKRNEKYETGIQEDDDEDDDDFNLGALQEAAKQGDTLLRKYIKRLSQRLHDKAVQEHNTSDSRNSNLQNDTTEKDEPSGRDFDDYSKHKWTRENAISDIEHESDIHPVQNGDIFLTSYHENWEGKVSEQNVRQNGRLIQDGRSTVARENDFLGDQSRPINLESSYYDHVENKRSHENMTQGNYEPKIGQAAMNLEPMIEEPPVTSVAFETKVEEAPGTSMTYDLKAEDTLLNSTATFEPKIAKTSVMTTYEPSIGQAATTSVMTYEPSIGQAAMTSSKLQELGLLNDMFAEPTKNSTPAGELYTNDDVIAKETADNLEELQLQTHRAEERPFSPLKSVYKPNHTASISSLKYDLSTSHNVTMKDDTVKETDFAYIHIPSPHQKSNDAFTSNDQSNVTSSGVEETERKLDPKPPKVGKRPGSASSLSYRRSNINHASPTSTYPKRPKTPERHIVGVREHHHRDRVARQQSPERRNKKKESSSPNRGASLSSRSVKREERTGRSNSRLESAKTSVVSFQRGVSPEPQVKSLSVPSLDLDEDDDSFIGDDHDGEVEDMLDEFEGLDADDYESVLMQKIADFRPQSGIGQVDAGGDAPVEGDKYWCPQVSFDLPHQEEIDDLLNRSEGRKGNGPAARPSSAGPQRSKSGLSKTRPSSAKSKVSHYMSGTNQYKRRWATSSSLWGSRSMSNSAGDLQVAGQRSKVNDMSSSPNLVRKGRPESGEMSGSGDAKTESGSNALRGQRSRPWSAGVSRSKEEFLRVGSAQLQDGQIVRALDSYRDMSMPPLTMRLICESPRTSEGISIWQLLPDEILLHIFSNLTHYELVQCAQSCSLFKRIAMDESLWRHIQLEKKVVTDFGLTQIGERHPTHLELIQCTGNITENGLRNLFRSCADNLKECNVSGCSNGELSGDSLLLHASRCYNLISLDASWCNVTDNGLTAIKDSVRQLRSLCLNGCREISDNCLRAVVNKHGKSLKVLEVFGCFNLSTSTLELIGEECTHLTTLNIGQCYKLTDESIGKLAPKMKGLRHLDLRGCKQIRDICVRKLVRHCKKLESFVLANCTHIGNTALNEIGTYLPSIRHLDLAGCKKVSNEGVKALATNCHYLTTLDISSTSIDHKSVAALASYCNKSLEGLKLNCCKEINETCIVKLLKHCKQLKTVHLYGVKRLHTLSVLKLQYPCLMYDENKSRVPSRHYQVVNH